MMMNLTPCVLLALLSSARASNPYHDLVTALEAKYDDRENQHQVTRASLRLGETEVSYLAAGPRTAERLVLFLHGAVFSARTWQIVGSLDQLASHGYQACAIDLRSRGANRHTLVSEFLDALGWRHRVLVVAASAGGMYGTPFVFAHPERVAGYVSIAALMDGSPRNGSSTVPALAIWGELDRPQRAGPTLSAFASSHLVIFPGAPHPAYLKDPLRFNKLILEFASHGEAGGSSGLPVAAAWDRRRRI